MLRLPTSDPGSTPGVWMCTHLYEPRGVLVDTSSFVCWVQSQTGLFIDLRIPDAPAGVPRTLQSLKCFAGQGELRAGAPPTFIWTRTMDFRVPGTPDVGTVEYLEADVMQEDSVLPGDDYRELWRRVDKPSDRDVALVLQHTDDAARCGYFLRVGNTWALVLDRPSSVTAPSAAWFSPSTALSEEQRTSLRAFTGCVGSVTQDPASTENSSVDTWHITHSLDAALEGQSPACLGDRVRGFRLVYGHGHEHAPAWLLHALSC